MDPLIEMLLQDVRDKLETLSEFERLEIFAKVAEGFCQNCGKKLDTGEYCQCVNEE